jgi:hypothetical protein
MRALEVCVLTSLFTLSASGIASAAATRPTVVELYTSQGCSSCPPAEALMPALAARADVLPLAFHVDYWDDLGWRDPFSMKEATARQNVFAKTLKLTTTGTPQFIVEGRTSVFGADRARLEKALTTPRGGVSIDVAAKERDLVIDAPSIDTSQMYDVFVVGYLPSATTRIVRGENAGHTVTEVNIVRYVRKIGDSGGGRHQWSFPLKSLPPEADHLAVLVQSHDTGAIAGALAMARNDLTALNSPAR